MKKILKSFLQGIGIAVLIACFFMGGLRLINPAEFYTRIGLRCWHWGLIMWSITNYNKAIEHNPEYAKAYRSRGVALYDLGKYKLALHDNNRAVKLDPKSQKALVLKNRGVAYMWLGEEKLARQDFETACRMGKCIDFESMCQDLELMCDMGKCEGLEFAKKEGYCLERN
jgi:tetratricopeptide (TPR) repeat protein